ncbi:MAG: aminoglycoside phosphotransferase family protein [Phycisphaerales bacterium]|nr:aminoglycoside phosphotransferase family protein [Phycisphaerales bacterium]
MWSDASIDAGGPGARQLANTLLPHLHRACGSHLGDVHWFRADWQRGGAATGRANWKAEDGTEREVMVKFPIRARELLWMRRLQRPHGDGLPVVPNLFASGSSLESYDLAWIVIEWLPHGPLGKRWHADHVIRTAEAVTRFHQEADLFPIEAEKARREEWTELLDSARASIRRNHIDEEAHWQALLDRLSAALPDMVERWRARETDHWIHGDLHLANALSRIGAEHGEVTLIDLAEVRPGHWIEDAVYLERRLWARPERLEAARPVATIAEARRARGLPAESDYEELATVRRALMAGTAPAFMKTEGHPRHLAACRGQLEASLDRFQGA